jgi:hypothetical protein
MKNLIQSHLRAAALLCGTILVGAGVAKADQVIPDDLIVQGSLCVGLDCVNNESFGFSTIRLKENNTRIEFMDTSVSPFPTNDWMITANDSASGGASYLAFDDVTGSRQPFRVTAGAPTASLFVASTGKIGLRTATPLLDLHITTGDTPAHRLEQTNASGFTAQTWDIGGNEANFFVRDLTAGSRLPFRIRPGAPTSSLDIAASGNVGIGTASPGFKLHANMGANRNFAIRPGADLGGLGGVFLDSFNDAQNAVQPMVVRGAPLFLVGNVGIGASAPTAQLHTTGSVRFAGVANCGAGIVTNGSGDLSCLTSSMRFKNLTGEIPLHTAVSNIMALKPQIGAYKATPDVQEHWLIAEDVAAVDPALAGFADGKPFTVKTQNVVADLIVVVQQQQKRIEQLEQQLAKR